MRANRAFALLIAVPSCAFAQAWLSPQGEGTVSFLYQYGFDRNHSFSNGELLDRGHMYTQSMILDLDYSLTDRLAVRVGVPFIESRYDGTAPHVYVRGVPSTTVAIDDGNYHGGFQDFRFDVRYSLSRRRKLKVTPFFESIIPSNTYPSFGHASVGTDQREYRMGINAGRTLDPILPKAYVQGQYAFGLVQQVDHVAPKRGYGEFQFGYFVHRHLSVQASTIWTHSFNGIDLLYGIYPNNLPQDQWLNHDRISRIELVDLGISGTYAVNRSTGLFLGWGHSVFGENTHMRAVVLTVGFTKSFSTHSGEKSAISSLLPEKKALVCTCARTK